MFLASGVAKHVKYLMSALRTNNSLTDTTLKPFVSDRNGHCADSVLPDHYYSDSDKVCTNCDHVYGRIRYEVIVN